MQQYVASAESNLFAQDITNQIIANAKNGERTIVTQLENGKPFTYVPLDDDEDPYYAILDQVTFAALCERGVPTKWSVDKRSGKPIVWSPKIGRMVYVARLAANCANDQTVTCVDGNNLNLRQSNLLVETNKQVKERDNFEPGLGQTQFIKYIDTRTFGLPSPKEHFKRDAYSI